MAKVFSPPPQREQQGQPQRKADPTDQLHQMWLEWGSCQLTHCGVVRPIANWGHPLKPVLVYPLWNGGDLNSWIQKSHGTHSSQRQVAGGPPPKEPTEEERWKISVFKANVLEISLALLETLAAMHRFDTGWLHCDLHAKNILVHFPEWEWTSTGKRERVPSPSLVFVAISDLGRAFPKQLASDPRAPRFPNWNVKPPANMSSRDRQVFQQQSRLWPHIAPELTNQAPNLHNVRGPQLHTEYTDVFALGSSIKRMCEGFFNKMKIGEYNTWSVKRQDPECRKGLHRAKDDLHHLIHKMASKNHDTPSARGTALQLAEEWKAKLGVSSSNCFRPLQKATENWRQNRQAEG